MGWLFYSGNNTYRVDATAEDLQTAREWAVTPGITGDEHLDEYFDALVEEHRLIPSVTEADALNMYCMLLHNK